MRYLYIIPILILTISCGKNSKKIKPENEYDKLKNIDSLIAYTESITESKDTIFLGFRLGMTKEQFKMRISELKKEGRSIKYKKGLNRDRFKKFFGINYASNGAYFFSSLVSRSRKNKDLNDEIQSGDGVFILLPIYNDVGAMHKLYVLSEIKWLESQKFSAVYTPASWLYSKTKDKYNKLSTYMDRNNLNNYFKEELGLSDSEYLIGGNTAFMKLPLGASLYQSKKELFSKIISIKLKDSLAKKESNKIDI